MYHCHFEDVEHVQMGMTGPLFVRPRQNGTVLGGFNKFAYNDGDGSTGYDREFALLLTEMYLESHWQDAHIQQPLWDQYHADAWFINGRSYPDTLAPTTGFYGPTEVRPTGIAVGDPKPWPNPRVDPMPRLSHQPLSSLVECNAGDRVLLRMANLGYQLHAMTVPGLVLDVVGKDATLLANGGRQDVDADRDDLDRTRRELRLPLHRAGRRVPPPRTCSTTAPTRRRRTATSRASAACARKSASTRRARCPPRPRPMRKDTSMRLLTHPSHFPAAAPRPRAPSCCSRAVLLAPAAGSHAATGPSTPDGVVCTYGSEGQNATTQTFTLTARDGHITTPDGNTVYMWGFADGKGAFQYPGPEPLRQAGRQGARDPQEHARRPTSIVFPGQADVLADGVAATPEFGGRRLTSLTPTAPPGGTMTYSFVADQPGTYLYESGTDKRCRRDGPLRLDRRPALPAPPIAYNAARTAFDPSTEFVQVLSDLDPAIHVAVERGRIAQPRRSTRATG